MGFNKKEFTGNYKKWFTTIVSHGITNISDLPAYSGVADEVGSLNWKGQNRDSVCENAATIDDVCQNFNESISVLIGKVKIVNGVFIKELAALRDKIMEYNDLVDEYYRIDSALNAAIAAKNSQEGDSNE